MFNYQKHQSVKSSYDWCSIFVPSSSLALISMLWSVLPGTCNWTGKLPQTANKPTIFTCMSSYSAQAATLEEPMDPLFLLHGFRWQRQNAGGVNKGFKHTHTKLIVMHANQSAQRVGGMSKLKVRSLCLQLIKCCSYWLAHTAIAM